jgi:hypothetical protein
LFQANYRELSTFERWQSEVSTKQLKWGSRLVHCEKFWRENASALERHDFKELKVLLLLLLLLLLPGCSPLRQWLMFVAVTGVTNARDNLLMHVTTFLLISF